MFCAHAWRPPDLVALQLRERTTHRTCYYCDAALALDEHDVVVAPWGEVMVHPGLRLPTTDHRIPTSRGGTDELSNLVLACGSCNSSKGNKTDDEFFAFQLERGDFDYAAAA